MSDRHKLPYGTRFAPVAQEPSPDRLIVVAASVHGHAVAMIRIADTTPSVATR